MTVTPPRPADMDPQNDEMMTILINDEQHAAAAATAHQKYIYKFDGEPLCKWCGIYTALMVVLGGGLIVLVYFLWR
jgi:hypothetical protein